MIKSERQMTFICDVQGLRWKFWKEMSTFFSIFFSKFKKNITQKYYTEINRNKFQPITTFTINASKKKSRLKI
jgi:hypothetical protein